MIVFHKTKIMQSLKKRKCSKERNIYFILKKKNIVQITSYYKKYGKNSIYQLQLICNAIVKLLTIILYVYNTNESIEANYKKTNTKHK